MHTIVADYPGPPGRGLPVLLDARHLFARAGGTDPYHAPRAGLEHGRALTRLGRYDDAHRPHHTALHTMTAVDRPRGRAPSPTTTWENSRSLSATVTAPAPACTPPLYHTLGDREEAAVHATRTTL
ncbi:hypothetical protein [Catenuloplanes atrovinosus]|uniref:Uncharacterized protein n=1 Tax=Catenuloplanes atrovinosus TaxID=137266 RepID=A0AAE4CAK7_9ACTN|nr:hypothetical protein [Catenuloplanes atrovinosus]MDR7277691.1 hypothetical protein [Catenuloplanes atrovinosus]